MTTTISADNGTVSGTAGLKSTADSSGILVLQTGANTTAVTIDASQNVTVGGTTVGNAGTVNVSIGAPGTTIGGLQLWTNTTSSSYLQWGTAASGTSYYRGYLQYNYNAGSDYLAFGIAGTEAMRLTGGNLLVGTTTATSAGRISVTTATDGNGVGINALKSLNSNYYLLSFKTNGTGVGEIYSNGSTTTYATSSDYRLKNNIQPMTGALAKVVALKPVTYIWKNTGLDGQGFIAHELQEIVPDCVGGIKDAVDSDGNPKYQSIDTSFLVATLTAAIQEQQALIQSLTTRLTALEGKA
jgi:hypothetical protein